jgi:hypothetical protein
LARLIERRSDVDLRPLGISETLDTASWSSKQAAFSRIESWVHQDLEARAEQVLHWCHSLGFETRSAAAEDMLTWSEVRALAQDPLVSIGAHGITHHRLSRLSDDAVRSELFDAKRKIESEIGLPVRHLAYPFGGRLACGAREFALAREAGFLTAVTTRRGALFPDHSASLTSLPRQRLSGALSGMRMNRRSALGTDWLLRRGPVVVTD